MQPNKLSYGLSPKKAEKIKIKTEKELQNQTFFQLLSQK